MDQPEPSDTPLILYNTDDGKTRHEYDKFCKIIDLQPSQVDKDLEANIKNLPKPPKL